ncbi:MAG: DUF3426 domain-containing protein [Lysobacter sp.]|nr:DUF3426 domain-containing protein [Lysobacter sp.]
MFINCPYCRTLVATDPVTDLPPTHCPQCMSLLRRDATVEDDDTAPLPIDLGDLLESRADDAAEEKATVRDAFREAADPDAPDDIANGIEAETPPSEDAFDDALDREEERGAEVVAPAVAEPAAGAAVPVAAAAVAPGNRRSRNAPSFVRGAGGTPASPRERWLPAIAAMLALLLGLQWLLADRARLAADPQWRPVLNAVCKALRCELPPWREPAAFTLLQRDVRQHPDIPGALRVSATFRNDARWSQPWPSLRLTLSDVNGRPAGERSFRAEEYLGGPPSQPELASGESATVAMDILEPAARIVAYDFSFR